MTAEAEHAISVTASREAGARNTKPDGPPDLARYLPLIREAIENETTHVEDEFQARTCLAWLYWQLDELPQIASGLPDSIANDFAQLDGTNKESSGWSRICAIKAAHMKAISLERTGSVAEALDTYASVLPMIQHGMGKETTVEWIAWSELFLTGYCLVTSRAMRNGITLSQDPNSLAPFRAWRDFWGARNDTTRGGSLPQARVPRRQIWLEYYLTISDYLQQGTSLPSPAGSNTSVLTKLQHKTELSLCESVYFSLLMAEVEFPKAEEHSDEIESFVSLLLRNWRVLCGPSWPGADLGDDGKMSLTRTVLNMLYKAATRTFHSTAILRHLFSVHLALAEFDMAFKAFDTYLDIVKNGKERERKTGEPEHALDDNDTVMMTGAECLEALCQYGVREAAEKAYHMALYFDDWLVHLESESSDTNGDAVAFETSTSQKSIDPTTLALIWRSIGITYGHWARLTFDASSREQLQSKAIASLRKSLSSAYMSSSDSQTIFALAVVLAEQRKIGAAIQVIKSGLLDSEDASLGPHTPRHHRQRKLIPLWHLLALLVSSRQDFATAMKSCEGAFEQFQDPKILFGELQTQSNHIKFNDEKFAPSGGLVDEMSEAEKCSVLEVKMTQLALMDILEGPEVAVNASDELLSLYARLFGKTQSEDDTAAVPVTELHPPPKTSAGTVKSLTGSIFSRSSRSMRLANPAASGASGDKSLLALRPKTSQSTKGFPAPTIQVTSESGTRSPRKLHSLRASSHPSKNLEKLQKRNGSMKKKESEKTGSEATSNGISTPNTAEISPTMTTDKPTQVSTVVDGEGFFTPTVDKGDWIGDGQQPASPSTAMVEGEDNATTTLAKHHTVLGLHLHKPSMSVDASPRTSPAKEVQLPPLPAVILPPRPAPAFGKKQLQRRRKALLVKVWLSIANFYRRASMIEDAKGALSEALNIVTQLDEEEAGERPSVHTQHNIRLARQIKVDGLYADVYTEVCTRLYLRG